MFLLHMRRSKQHLSAAMHWRRIGVVYSVCHHSAANSDEEAAKPRLYSRQKTPELCALSFSHLRVLSLPSSSLSGIAVSQVSIPRLSSGSLKLGWPVSCKPYH